MTPHKTLEAQSGSPLQGTCKVPGDKSISHRAVMFSSIAEGRSHIRGFLDGGDCMSTVGVMRALGVDIELVSSTELLVSGRGLHGLQEPSRVLDCGNSGTTLRLLTGLLAGQRFTSVLTGSDQLQRRPMKRVVEPLRLMGAHVIGREHGRLAPLAFEGTPLTGFTYEIPVASAQVKSCLLLAGLYANGVTETVEPGPARDHTERMLRAMGAPLRREGASAFSMTPESPLKAIDITVPGDPSSAAFLLVAASITPGSALRIEGVGTNPTRTGLLKALQAMGAAITVENPRDEGGEPVADLIVEHGALTAATFSGEHIVTMIDEIPILAVAATQATGTTVIRDAAELRVKETDRIATTVSELTKLGARVEARPDGMVIEGPTPLRGADVSSHGDHRLAMAMTIAGLIAEGTTRIDDAAVSADSFPGFEALMMTLGAPLRWL